MQLWNGLDGSLKGVRQSQAIRLRRKVHRQPGRRILDVQGVKVVSHSRGEGERAVVSVTCGSGTHGTGGIMKLLIQLQNVLLVLFDSVLRGFCRLAKF